MYVNRGELGGAHECIVDHSRPLLITAVGHYRLLVQPKLDTDRREGRKDYQLLYIVDGCAHVYFDGVERIVEKGNVILFRPDQPQVYDLYQADGAETMWVHFTGSAVDLLLSECGIPADQSVFWIGTQSDNRWLYQQMIEEIQVRDLHYEEMLCSALRRLLLLMHRHMTAPKAADEENRISGEITNAIRYFSMHYNWDISVGEYAASKLMTEYWFTENFKRVTHTTPKQYIISLRMTNAMHYLDSTEYSVAQVAAAVGYENTQYFHRLFRKHTGMTPAEYRRRNKK